jgi:hypothetical protein
MTPDKLPAAQPKSKQSEHTLNQQICDAVIQVQTLLGTADNSIVKATTLQAVVHIVALALHNAVAEQQQNQTLRLALTTSAAKALLDGKKSEAESILELANSQLVSPDLNSLLGQVRTLVETLSREVERVKPQPESKSRPSPNPPRPAGAARKKAGRRPSQRTAAAPRAAS